MDVSQLPNPSMPGASFYPLLFQGNIWRDPISLARRKLMDRRGYRKHGRSVHLVSIMLPSYISKRTTNAPLGMISSPT